ncbi:hypothetical protein OAO87_03870 [bacterium]|nr:hypothetical protein [bacterium]
MDVNVAERYVATLNVDAASPYVLRKRDSTASCKEGIPMGRWGGFKPQELTNSALLWWMSTLLNVTSPPRM